MFRYVRYVTCCFVPLFRDELEVLHVPEPLVIPGAVHVPVGAPAQPDAETLGAVEDVAGQRDEARYVVPVDGIGRDVDGQRGQLVVLALRQPQLALAIENGCVPGGLFTSPLKDRKKLCLRAPFGSLPRSRGTGRRGSPTTIVSQEVV